MSDVSLVNAIQASTITEPKGGCVDVFLHYSPPQYPIFRLIVPRFAHISAKYLNFAVCFAHLTKNYATKSNLNTQHNDIRGEGVKWRNGEGVKK